MPRQEKKYHFIYKTTNLLSGKYYIGMHSTDDLNDGYMGSGKRLRYSLNKYGKGNHKVEILEFFDNREELGKREKEIVCLDELAKAECMNLVVGGEGFALDRALLASKALQYKLKNDIEFLKEQKRRISAGVQKAHDEGRMNVIDGGWNRGLQLSEQHKRSIGESNSVSQKGERNSQYGKCWVNKDDVNLSVRVEEADAYLNDGWKLGKHLLPVELIQRMKKFKESGNSFQKTADKFGIPKTTVRKYLK